MKAKKKLVLVPSAYNHRAMGDVENFIPYYKDELDVYVITDEPYPKGEIEVDGVHYVKRRTKRAKYLEATADYIIDAGGVNAASKLSPTQKRISVWHGVPYKSMFVDLAREHIVSAYDYASCFDLLVSPSKWYTDRFLRRSMLYEGEVLETAVSRTDSLYLDDSQKRILREALGIADGKKILLYAPTFRERGEVSLPFSPKEAISALGDDWIVLTKLHYLNDLKRAEGVIDVTDYETVNHLLALADLLVTDYSSLLFDYSVLGKPALLYQYDREEYEADRSFMFDMEDFVSRDDMAFSEGEFYKRLKTVDLGKANLAKLKEAFYPHQKPYATAELVQKLALDTEQREIGEVVFLVNELNQIGGVHSFVLNLARQFKERYGSKIIVIGNREFDYAKDNAYMLEADDLIDLKLSAENDRGYAEAVVKGTDGYIISCQYSVHRRFQRFTKGKKAILMFHGDTKDVVGRTLYKVHLDSYNGNKVRNYRRFALLSRRNWEVIYEALADAVREKSCYIENGMDFSDEKNLYKENGQFAFVSRLDPDKNPLEVIDVFSSDALDPAYRLHIYGDGSLRKDMEERVREEGLADRIVFHGYVGDKEEIYRDKQGVVLTSLSEGLPFTVVEATKYGIPVYAYNSFTSCDDIITDRTGVKIATQDIDAFVRALNDGFDISEFDSSEIKERFSNDEVTRKWKSLFEELDEEVAREQALKGELERLGAAPKKTGRRKRKKKKGKLSARVKAKVRRSRFLRNNEIYPKMAVKWRRFRGRENWPGEPLVSVVMPFYYNGDTIERAVKSVVKNGYDNIEIIVVNDGSTDNPSESLKKFHQVRYFYKENEGPGLTRNFGMDRARGKYVIFLDSDDVMYPGAIGKLVRYAEKNALDVVAGKTLRYYVQSKKREDWYPFVYRSTYINMPNERYRLIDDNVSTAKLYNLEMLRSLNMRFEPGLYEDALFIGDLFTKVERVGVLSAYCQIWMVYGTSTSISTGNTLDNVKERLEKADIVFGLQTEIVKVFYTRQYIRHHLIASLNGFVTFDEDERRELFALLRQGMLMRQPYILDKLVAVPSKKALYRYLLDDDYEHFALLAEGYSEKYIAFHNETK